MLMLSLNAPLRADVGEPNQPSQPKFTFTGTPDGKPVAAQQDVLRVIISSGAVAKGEAIPKSHESLLPILQESFPGATGTYDAKDKAIYFNIGGNGPAKEVASIRAVSCCAVNSRFEVQTTLTKLDAPKTDVVTVNADAKKAEDPFKKFLTTWALVQHPFGQWQAKANYSPYEKQRGWAEIVLVAKN